MIFKNNNQIIVITLNNPNILTSRFKFLDSKLNISVSCCEDFHPSLSRSSLDLVHKLSMVHTIDNYCFEQLFMPEIVTVTWLACAL